MSVNVGTTTTSYYYYKVAYSRSIVKASSGTLFLVADINNVLKYKRSFDDGDTWDGSWTTIATPPTFIFAFDIHITDNDDIYIAWCEHSPFKTYFKKLTHNSGDTWSLGSDNLVASVEQYWPKFAIRSNGDFWISTKYNTYYSTNSGADWTQVNHPFTPNNATAIMAQGSDMWLFVQTAGKISYYIYTSSWGSENVIASSGITNDYKTLGMLKVSDNDIWVACKTASGIKVFHYTGTWDSGTVIGEASSDDYPAICKAGTKIVVSWRAYTNDDILYRIWNGSSWEDQIYLNQNSINDWSPRSLESDSSTFYLMYLEGESSPRDVLFDKVVIDTPVLEVDEAETITLSDEIVLNLSLEKLNSSEQITLDDEIDATRFISSDLNDALTIDDAVLIQTPINLSKADSFTMTDEISLALLLNKSESISLSELSDISPSQIKLPLAETVTVTDTIAIQMISPLKQAVKIISYNPLIVISSADPLKLAKVDITDPANPTWDVYKYPGVSDATDVIYNATFDVIYVACGDGKILQIDGTDLSTSQIVDTSDSNDLLTLASLDDFHKLYAGTDDTTGEILYIDNAILSQVNMDIRCLEVVERTVQMNMNTVNAGILGMDVQCLGTISNVLGMDVRCITDPFDEIAYDVINQTDFHVKINSVEVEDIELDSIVITHVIDEKSTATFQLRRKHDAFNSPIGGGSSQIGSQNPVQIYIQGHLEFTGTITTINTLSEDEVVKVIAKSTSDRGSEKRTITVPMSGLNVKLHPYDCLVHNPLIYNPAIDVDDEDPEYYNGIEVDLGLDIHQSISRWHIYTSVADELITGEFQPDQNWTYFWEFQATNYFEGFGTNARYIGTSPASMFSDIWLLDYAFHSYQREFDDKQTELGLYQLGSAPYKSIHVRNGSKRTKNKWVDKSDGLYRQKDEGYNFVQYAKDVADLEFEKIKNINGDVLPRTSCDIELMIDGYYYYNPKLLTKINVDNTTDSGIFKNSNGFPVAVKSISISSSTMRVALGCDNELSKKDIKALDDQYPDPESDEYTFPEELALQLPKYDFNKQEWVQ